MQVKDGCLEQQRARNAPATPWLMEVAVLIPTQQQAQLRHKTLAVGLSMQAATAGT
jgi:hypothetical protein